MAESQNRKTPASAAKGTGRSTATAKPKTDARRSNLTAADQKSATAQKTTQKKVADKKPTAKGDKTGRKPAPEQQAAKLRRKSRFSEQFMPYIWGAIALFLGACFALNAIGDAATPSEHLMGVVGYYICYFLFGCFGWTAYLIPLVLVNLAVFWKRYCEERLVAIKITLSVVLMALVSALIHVAVCHGNPAMAETYNPLSLYHAGAVFESGGVIGGLLGFVLYLGLRLPGTIVLEVVMLPLVMMCLVGVTPAYVFGKLWAAIKVWRKKHAEKKALRAEERERRAEEEAALAAAEADTAKREATDEAYRARRERLSEAPSEPAAPKAEKFSKTEKAARSAEPAAETPEHEGDSDNRPILVNPATGEVLGTVAPTATPAHTLPMYEPAPAQTAETEQASDPLADRMAASAMAKASDNDLPWNDEEEDDDLYVEKRILQKSSADQKSAGRPEYRSSHPAVPLYADEEEREDEEMDSMVVDWDDEEPDGDPDGNPAAGGIHYEVVHDNGAPATSVPRGETVTVRILKSDTSAVDEAGLSEEELVLPTAHADEEEAPAPAREYVFPSVEMLTRGNSRYEANEAEIAANTQTLREVLESFHIRVKEISCSCGPTVTRFEVKPDSGVRVRSIANLVDDIAMNLAKAGVRIEAPIPGKAAVGIEVPNADPSTVYLRNILEAPEFRNHKSRIASCLGADVSGRPVILDINKMPHLLIAGATGMGKSVCINSIIMSILYKAKPDEVKLILIDPKKVEFAMYRDLPHLYAPIVSDPKKAAGALNSAVNEMERRFELIEEVGVRNIAGYNEVTADDPERPALPQMVIIIDELADLMMTAPSDVETAICRLAQKARAAGIHLIIGTQRPSVDVITGLIKANIPSRIAFTVASSVDSRTIIDTVGADKLIGRGDMLYAPVGATKPMRVQGTFVSESEVERVVTFIKEHNEKAEYNEEFTRNIDVEAAKCGVGKKKADQMSIDDFDGLGGGGEDPKFWEALDVIVELEKVGTSALQRKCKIGYGKAAGIIDRMEELGFVGPDPGTKQGRKVYLTKQDLMEYKINGLPGSRSGGDESGDEGIEL